MSSKFETAHEGWDAAWSTDKGRENWITPDPFVTGTMPLLKDRGCVAIADVGCGVGRHAMYFASHGMTVTGVDESGTGLEFLENEAEKAGYDITTAKASFTNLPFDDASLDAILSFNVIYHGNGDTVSRAISETRRCLRAGSIFFGTLLSKRNSDFQLGEEVDTDTFLRTHGFDEGHPHYYANASDVVRLMDGFELLALSDNVHRRPDSWHWHFVAEAV